MAPEKTTENLERYYQSFINQKRNLDFLTCLADYVRYAYETPEITKILKDIIQKKTEAEKNLDEYKKAAIKEIEEVKNELSRRIKEKKISYESLDKLIQKYEDYKNKKVLTLESEPKILGECLKDIIKNLYENGHKKVIKDFIIEERMPSGPFRKSKNTYIRSFTCFKNLDAYNYAEKFYRKKQDVELWGPWENLISLYHLFILNDKESLEKWWIQKDAIISYVTRIHNYLIQELSKKDIETLVQHQGKNCLKSIHLITNHLIGDRLDLINTIFLVLDGHFEKPIRCAVKNKRGEPTYIKKLYDIAYIANAPGKRVDYDKRVADNTNNGLFKKRRVAEYIKTNKLKKPTLVQKSEDGNYLVLKNEIPVKTGLVKHDVPLQYQSLYIDKTN